MRQYRSVFTAALGLAAAISPAMANESPQNSEAFGYIVVIIVAVGTIVGLATIRSSLLNSTWSLADALSEEAEVSLIDEVTRKPVLEGGRPVLITKLCPSTSRFIALIGLIAILMLYIGFGLVDLQRYGGSGAIPKSDDLKNIMYFLLGGVTMFAPYLINKFASAFDWLTPKKP